MRIRDSVAIFICGQTVAEVQLYFGWYHPSRPIVSILATLVTLGTLYGACALYDHFNRNTLLTPTS